MKLRNLIGLGLGAALLAGALAACVVSPHPCQAEIDQWASERTEWLDVTDSQSARNFDWRVDDDEIKFEVDVLPPDTGVWVRVKARLPINPHTCRISEEPIFDDFGKA